MNTRVPLFFLLAGLALFAVPARAQSVTPNCNIRNVFTNAGANQVYDNRHTLCTAWQLSYVAAGYTTLSIELDSAPDVNGAPGVWSPVITLSSPTGASGSWVGTSSWLRILITSAVGSGNITVIAGGYLQNPGASSGSKLVSSDPTGQACTGNAPMLVFNGLLYSCQGGFYAVYTSSSGATQPPIVVSSNPSGNTCATNGVALLYAGGLYACVAGTYQFYATVVLQTANPAGVNCAGNPNPPLIQDNSGDLFSCQGGTYQPVVNPIVAAIGAVVTATDPTGSPCLNQIYAEIYNGNVFTCQGTSYAPLPGTNLSYLNGAPNSVNRSISSKLQERISVKDFGARGDSVKFIGTTSSGSSTIANIFSTAGIVAGQSIAGQGIPPGTTITNVTANSVSLSANATSGASGFFTTGNDSIALANACNSSTTLSKTLYFPAGQYATDTLVNCIALGATIDGDGPLTAVVRNRTGVGDVFAVTGLSLHQATVKNIGIDGNGTSGSGLHYYANNFDQQVTAENLIINNVAGKCIWWEDSYSSTVNNTQCSSSGDNGIDVWGAPSISIRNSYVHTVGQGKAGYRVHAGPVLLQSDNGLDNTQLSFIGITSTGNSTISGIASTASLVAGQSITGNGIPSSTTIASVAANSITISNPANASSASQFFVGLSYPIPNSTWARLGNATADGDPSPQYVQAQISNSNVEDFTSYGIYISNGIASLASTAFLLYQWADSAHTVPLVSVGIHYNGNYTGVNAVSILDQNVSMVSLSTGGSGGNGWLNGVAIHSATACPLIINFSVTGGSQPGTQSCYRDDLLSVTPNVVITGKSVALNDVAMDISHLSSSDAWFTAPHLGIPAQLDLTNASNLPTTAFLPFTHDAMLMNPTGITATPSTVTIPNAPGGLGYLQSTHSFFPISNPAAKLYAAMNVNSVGPITTTETPIITLPIPANTIQAFSIFRLTVQCQGTSTAGTAGNSSFFTRLGPNGNSTDTQLAAVVQLAGTSGSNVSAVVSTTVQFTAGSPSGWRAWGNYVNGTSPNGLFSFASNATAQSQGSGLVTNVPTILQMSFVNPSGLTTATCYGGLIEQLQ
jgi:hypothetical protein